MFTISFLDLTKRWPMAAWILTAVVTAALLLSTLSIVLPYNLAVKLATILVLPSTLLCLAIGSVLLYQGMRRARYFVAGWLVYGVLMDSLPVILANAITLAFAATILALKLRAVIGVRRQQLPAGA